MAEGFEEKYNLLNRLNDDVGRLKGVTEDLQRTTVRIESDINARIVRMENSLADGFRNSQKDREIGAKTLGTMIEQNREEFTKSISELASSITKGQLSQATAKGAVSFGSYLLQAIIVLAAAYLGTHISH